MLLLLPALVLGEEAPTPPPPAEALPFPVVAASTKQCRNSGLAGKATMLRCLATLSASASSLNPRVQLLQSLKDSSTKKALPASAPLGVLLSTRRMSPRGAEKKVGWRWRIERGRADQTVEGAQCVEDTTLVVAGGAEEEEEVEEVDVEEAEIDAVAATVRTVIGKENVTLYVVALITPMMRAPRGERM